MESNRIHKWSKIIALWTLFVTLLGICFYVLIQIGVIEETLTPFDLFNLFFTSTAGIFIFVGLWLLCPWGWNSAVLLIPISWALSAYSMAVDYYQWLGIVTSPFLIIDALIIRYLFKPKVIELFKVSSKILFRLKWCANALFLFAIFLIVNDIFGDFVALVTIIAFLLGLEIIRNKKKRLNNLMILQ